VTEEPAATEPVPGRVRAPVRVGGPPDRQGTLKDLSRPGRRAFSLPALDVPEAGIPQDQLRIAPPGLPEVVERDIVSHYTRLSQQNYGVDTGMYPLGSCSMKYNPKIAESVAALPGFARLHPLQPASTTQGALELLWRLERGWRGPRSSRRRARAASSRVC
jgi:glycine dehydrogenase subunit 2